MNLFSISPRACFRFRVGAPHSFLSTELGCTKAVRSLRMYPQSFISSPSQDRPPHLLCQNDAQLLLMKLMILNVISSSMATRKKPHSVSNKSFLLASRKGVVPAPFRGVQFDWYDPATYENPFTADPHIKSVYPVSAPWADGILASMVPFIDLVMQKVLSFSARRA